MSLSAFNNNKVLIAGEIVCAAQLKNSLQLVTLGS